MRNAITFFAVKQFVCSTICCRSKTDLTSSLITEGSGRFDSILNIINLGLQSTEKIYKIVDSQHTKLFSSLKKKDSKFKKSNLLYTRVIDLAAKCSNSVSS